MFETNYYKNNYDIGLVVKLKSITSPFVNNDS